MALVLVACAPQLARAFLGRAPILDTFYNINIALELFLLFLFFRNEFSTKKRNRIFKILFVICLLSGITSIFVFGISEKFLTEWLCVNNITYTAWILLLVLDLYEDDRMLQLPSSMPWYVLGIFFYSSCTILIFSLWQYIMTNRDSYLKNLWIIHDAFNVIMYVSFTIGFIVEIRVARYIKNMNS